MKQISSEESVLVSAALVNGGIEMADTAAVVPILRLSRRVIL
jgi:hypothetical protein